MLIGNLELLKNRRGTLKFILNDTGILFFPAAQQHRDFKMQGMSYEDDYKGNALAGIVSADHVEIRFHKAFSDDRVRALWARVTSKPEFTRENLGKLYYQGREIV